ncbi:MAG: glycosyltransferase family 4 protein [Roseovarius sp.]
MLTWLGVAPADALWLLAWSCSLRFSNTLARLSSDMRVALVSDWCAPRRGGVESQLCGLSRGLTAAGKQVALITSQPGAVGQGVPVIAVPTAHLPGTGLAMSPRLVGHMRRALIDFAPDIVHIHASIVAPTCLAGVLAARQVGLPTVVTFHSDMRVMAPLLRLAGRGVWVDVHLSAVSRPIARQLAPLHPGGEVTVLPNGFDAGFWGCDRAPTPPDDCFRVVTALRIERKKRPLVLSRLRAEVARRTGCQTELIIAGQGRQQGRLGADVEVRGWMNRTELRALYRRAHVFVMPSTCESFGIAALEARAAGLPIVGRSGTGLSTFLMQGRDGLLCASDKAMADACVSLGQDADIWRQMAGPRAHLQAFDWAHVISQHSALYARLRG